MFAGYKWSHSDYPGFYCKVWTAVSVVADKTDWVLDLTFSPTPYLFELSMLHSFQYISSVQTDRTVRQKVETVGTNFMFYDIPTFKLRSWWPSLNTVLNFSNFFQHLHIMGAFIWMSTKKRSKWDIFDSLWYPLSILLLAAIGAKLIGPHGGIQVDK